LLDTTGVTDLAPLMSLPAAARVVNARLHPGPLPQARESRAALSVNSSAWFAIAAAASFSEKRDYQPDMLIYPNAGERFSFSSRKRAGVRANALSDFQFPPR